MELSGFRHTFNLWPERWKQYSGSALTSPNWEMHRLDKAQRANIPVDSGIYTLLVQPGIAHHPACAFMFYIGQAANLRKRFNEYLTKEKLESGRPLVYRVLHSYPEHIWFCFSRVPKHSLTDCENQLLEAYLPPACSRFPATISKVVGAFP